MKSKHSDYYTDHPPESTLPNEFEKDRLENAAKRVEREQNGKRGNARGRGAGRGLYANKSVRFSDTTTMEPKTSAVTRDSSPKPNPFAKPAAIQNPFGAPPAATSPFGATSTPDTKAPFNPFAAALKADVSIKSFGNPNAMSSPFGASPSAPAQTNTSLGFDKTTTPSTGFCTPSNTPIAAPSATFGASAIPTNAWCKPVVGTGAFGATSTLGVFAAPTPKTSNAPIPPTSNAFGAAASAPLTGIPSNAFGAGAGSNLGVLGSQNTGLNSKSFGTINNAPMNGALSNSTQSTSPFTLKPASLSSNPLSGFELPTSKPVEGSLAAKVAKVLEKERIVPPAMPSYDLMFARQLLGVPELMKHLNEYKKYQSRVRKALMREGVIDDPEKPKSLADAIDFKGTCEDMCPQLEKIERLLEGRVDACEKGLQPDGTITRHAVLEKMVKIHARSSAGQDAPLPSEVRTTAALRRTVDYLMKEVLSEENLSQVHGFLWNRTRALRRDFVFHSFMTSDELLDQVYCLETIARFHSLALHLMSKPENSSEAFDTYQEFEQLSNTMISLLQAYDDCKANGITCENEAEFRAYSILIQRKTHPGLLDMVQSWGWDVYNGKHMKIALSLVEALANIWEMQGPLTPAAQTDVAQNATARYFEIVKDQGTSYTMACFAEIWFNDAREAIVRTIIASYRKQRDQVKDWTLSRLNEYLRFDDEDDIVPWGKARNMTFGEADGITYLSLEPGSDIDHLHKGKQYHSDPLVERKRGNRPLLEVLYNTVYEETGSEEIPNDEEDEGLFVKQTAAKDPWPKPAAERKTEQPVFFSTPVVAETAPAPVQEIPKPVSIFDRFAAAPTANAFSAQHRVEEPKPAPAFSFQPTNGTSPTGSVSFFNKPTVNGATSIFSQPSKPAAPPGSQNPPSFSFTSTSATSLAPSSLAPKSLSASGCPASAASTAPPISQKDLPEALPQPASQTQETLEPVPKPQLPTTYLPPPIGTFGTPQVPAPAQESFAGVTPQLQSTTPKGPVISAFPSLQVAKGTPTVFSEVPSPPFDPWTGFTDWYALGDDGIVDQFVSWEVEKILRTAVAQFEEEENVKAAKKADEAALAEANCFREKSLATKYGLLWCAETRRRSLKRRGREARRLRQEAAEESIAARKAAAANVVEEFKASTMRTRRNDSLESLLGATGILNGVHDPNRETRAVVQLDQRPATKRQRSDRSTRSATSSVSRHMRGKSDDTLRRSLMTGASRIHLIPNYTPQDEYRPQVSGVQTDYFRLKARGISTLPNGSPLATSAARMLYHKRSSDDFLKPSTPLRQPGEILTPRSVPTEPPVRRAFGNLVQEKEDDIEFLKARARAVMSEDSMSRSKRTLDDDEVELFARAKRVREQMDEGEVFYRREQESMSRSES